MVETRILHVTIAIVVEYHPPDVCSLLGSDSLLMALGGGLCALIMPVNLSGFPHL